MPTNMRPACPQNQAMLQALLLSTLALFAAQDHDVKASPFDGLRWQGDSPEVLLGDTWYVPVSIDELAVDEILATCERRWPGGVRKRFGEDLVEAMVLMGWEGDLEVSLELRRVSDGSVVQLAGVEMTGARRRTIWDGARATPPTRAFTAEMALVDVDRFEAGLRERFAYLSMRGIDLGKALAPVRASLEGQVDVEDLALQLHRVLMRFGDGHASVRAPGGAGETVFLPFLLADAKGGVVAFSPDRRQFADPERPFVTHLDGRPIDDWVAAATPYVPDGSPQLVRSRSMRGLREVERARRALGLPTGDPLEVTFSSGAEASTRAGRLSERRPTYGPGPRSESRRLDGDVGYLRLDRMDDDVESLRGAMAAFADTCGLVVDVRGNGGGSRDLLLALAGYLIGPDEPARVGNVARYRLAPGFDDDHLEARFMRRAGWGGWSDRQRDAIAAFAPGFRPEWTPPEAMSAWHYLVLDRTGHPDEYAYASPVVVLQDEGCFSATDIFLGALGELPRVTLLGTASAGGSARSQSFRLTGTGIEVRCASMASFRPDGRLYDGRGVEADVRVLPVPGDLLHGGEDVQLQAALALLERER